MSEAYCATSPSGLALRVCAASCKSTLATAKVRPTFDPAFRTAVQNLEDTGFHNETKCDQFRCFTINELVVLYYANADECLPATTQRTCRRYILQPSGQVHHDRWVSVSVSA